MSSIPRVIISAPAAGVPAGSGVAPVAQRAPCPRVSITRCAYPHEAHTVCSNGSPRPPLYPMYCTTVGSRPSAPAGVNSQARMGSPSNPGKVTSRTRNDRSGVATSATWGSIATVRAAVRVRSQNSSKSSGSVCVER
jgi:hypothetical protein